MRPRASTITLTVAHETTTNDDTDSSPVASIRISAPSGTSEANSSPKICVQWTFDGSPDAGGRARRCPAW